MSLRVFDKYEVIRRLASGGMGDIFLARQLGAAGFSRLVVLKSLRADIVERDEFFVQFLNEARTAATLNHPNVVAVYEVDEYRGVYFIAMEYIDGADLVALLRATSAAQQRIPFRVSASVVHDAALGLHHAHTAKDAGGRPLGIVHRDVSPQNVMVRLDGIAKVLDFGIAAAADRIDPFRGRLQGKLRYMSPEQLTGQVVDAASDQFSLGVVLWEMLAHDRLLVAEDATQILRQLAQGPLAAPSTRAPHVPAALDDIVLRMLALDPRARFPSMREAAVALRRFLDGAGAPADQQVARYVSVMVGAVVAERTRSLVPEPVTISGLLEPAELRCRACGATSSLRHRYCPECGAPLTPALREPTHARGRVMPPPPRASAPPGPRASLASPAPPGPRGLGKPAAPSPTSSVSAARAGAPSPSALRALLSESAAELDGLFEGEAREVVVLAARVLRHGPEPRGLDARVLRALSAALEPFDPTIVQLTAQQLVVAFDRGVADPMRALGLALELEVSLDVLAREMPGLALAPRVVLERGGAEVLGPGAAAFAVRGPALDLARARLGALEGVGVYLGASVAEALVGRVTVDATGRFLAYAEPPPAKRPRVVGRRDELVAAKETLSAAAHGQCRPLVFVGGPGMGKSALVDEVAHVAAKQGFITLSCRVGRGDGWTGAGLLTSMLREGLCELALGDPRAPPASRLGFLGLEASVRAQLEAHLEGRVVASDAVVAGAILRLSRLQATCWTVDDVHLASPEAEVALGSIEARLAEPGVRLALVYTSTQARAEARVVTLEPLSDEKLLAAVQAHTGGAPLPPPVAQLILVRSAGNPGVALAVLRALESMGGLVHEGTSWRVGPRLVELQLPHHLDGLLGAHLAALSRPAQALVRALAVLGSPAASDLVLDVLRYAGDREALLTEVLASGLVRRAEDERLELVQASVEARLSRGVLPADQRKIHARAAEVLRRVEAPSPAVRAAIVHHLVAAADDVGVAEQAPPAARAQPTQGAARVLWVAGLEALGRLRAGAPGSYDEVARRVLAEATPVVARGSLDEARRLLGDSGLDVDAPTEGAALARAARGEVLLALGQPSEAEADVRAAVALLPLDAEPAVRAPVVEALARVLEERGALPEAAEHLHAVAALYEAADDHAELWRPLNALGRLYVRLGRHDRAHALLLAASEAAAAAGSAPGRIATGTNRAALAAPADALVLLAEAAAVAADSGDALATARIAYNRGSLALSLGRLAEAEEALDLALRVSTELGWADGIALAHRARVAAGLT